jgi:hypothetical protein
MSASLPRLRQLVWPAGAYLADRRLLLFLASCSTKPPLAAIRWLLAAMKRRRVWRGAGGAHQDYYLRALRLVSAAAGIILASRMTSGQPMTSIGYELIVISACVLGACR